MLDLTKLNKAAAEAAVSKSSFGKTSIISARSHVASGLSTQVRMNGGQDINIINISFENMIDNAEISSSEYVIIDIADFRDVQVIEQKIKFLFPVSTKKLFVGDVDSIIFCDEMKRIGALYLHIDSQLMMLGATLKKIDEQVSAASYTQKLSILGCKGGSGTSCVALWLFKAFGDLSKLPVLLVQGHTSTPDLDLISDATLTRDGVITQINAHQGMKIETDEEAWKFELPDYQSYNIVIFDHNITTQIRDKLAFVIPGSDFIFIVVTRELSSVRNARLIIDELERTSSVQDSSKNIIILNENHQSKPDELSNEDIENYLGKSIDIVSPYRKDIKKTPLQSDLDSFAAKMLGKNNSDDKDVRVKKWFNPASIFKRK
ncbi:hypothetical protein JGC56_01115 [Salmonella enterica subsp. enterica serovar Saintpaul]|nr:hypothetical protein [Salmonella enterica subsp. enterica serovar Saintpaul]